MDNSNNSSFIRKIKGFSPKKTQKFDPNYSFSEGPSYLNEKTVLERNKTKLPHYKPSTSLAEENLVKNFNKFQKLENISLPTNQPQRIELPLFFNTPNRIQNMRQRSFTNNNNISKNNNNNYNNNTSLLGQSGNNNYLKNNNGSFMNGIQNRNLKGIKSQNVNSADYIRAQRRIKDYNTLGFACRRAGKIRDEGRTYYCQGVLSDNMGKFREGITYYKKFLQVCKTIGDSHGEALAYNCIGVNYQLLGEQEDKKYFDESIIYHKKHLELADINGKFLALINLGLCYDKMGLYEESMIEYQNALRHSIKMANLVGQTIAIGNIGKIGAHGLHANKEKMKIFVEKYMKLASELKDSNGEISAHIKLGNLDIQSRNYEQGKEQFEKALELAQMHGDQELFSYSKVGYAISNVEGHIQEYLKEYQQNIFQNLQGQKQQNRIMKQNSSNFSMSQNNNVNNSGY